MALSAVTLLCECLYELHTQPTRSTMLIHSQMQQLTVFINESMNHLRNSIDSFNTVLLLTKSNY